MNKARPVRLKLLKAVEARPHRYPLWRTLSQTFSLMVLVVVPMTGLARVDFWQGRHYLLLEPASFKHALAGVIIGIAAMYMVTFLSNLVAGRLFCGWGCPVGQVCRFGEAVDLPGMRLGSRLFVHLQGAAFSAVFVVSILVWWVDWRMLLFGEPPALLIGWGLVALGVGGAYLHGRWWRWEFCKTVCPIGVYYSFVSPAKWFGIHFRNQADTCLECDACDRICPVDLQPRRLAEPVMDRGGISLLDAPGFNHCLECGDCVRACEWMIQTRTPEHFPQGVPLLMGYYRGPQRVEGEKSTTSSASSD